MTLATVFILFSLGTLLLFNTMTNALCQNRNIPEERQPKVFRWINVLITILLISSYIEITFIR